MLKHLKTKIENKKATIGIVGLGYVGLPLAEAFSKNFNITGYDLNKQRIKDLKNGKDTNLINNKTKTFNSKLIFTHNLYDLQKSDFIIITVPTPIKINKSPDLSFLNSAFDSLVKLNLKNKIIILESTIYPTLSNLCIKKIQKKTKLKVNKDFVFAYSPERINPGDSLNRINNIDKIISVSNKSFANLIKSLYKTIIKRVHTSSVLEESELAKIIENAQRDINIGFINEIVMICHKLNIDPNKVINLASTKWNFLKFRPGLVGGHCIGVDPYYLTHKLKKINYDPKIILAGRGINENYHKYLVNFLNLKKKIKKNSKILIMGASYKEDCNDLRNSKSLELASILNKKSKVSIFDPHIQYKKKYNFVKKPKRKYYDIIIITIHHTVFFKQKKFLYKNSIKKDGIIYDIRNAKFI
tara:strand:+ start:1035 stop:2273 length:1239 start_codon:yes stop_codon:yes gene_type:complete